MLQNRSGMDEIAAAFDGVDHVLGQNEPLPKFDYYVHVMGLPRVFGTDLDSIPAEVPYLRVDPVRVERWSRRLASDAGCLKVGIAWAGRPGHERDAYRSIKLRTLLPICEIEGIEFYSLQKGEGEEEITAIAKASQLATLDARNDFDGTAALVAAMDLVISVDTSIAHLSGALARPTWILLAFAPDWRWQTAGSESRWYPTARLFRQSSRGNWPSVVSRVRSSLVEWIEQR